MCSGLSSSGARGQENDEKQAMVGATLPVQLLPVSSSPRKHPWSPAFWKEQLVLTVLVVKQPGLTGFSVGHLHDELVFPRW